MEGRELKELSSSEQEEARKAYHRKEQMPSPAGGVLEPVRVQPREEGGALVVFECTTSHVRYGLEIPKATSSERKKVRAMITSSQDPHCPRCGSSERLRRVGEFLGCSRCGVVYATVR